MTTAQRRDAPAFWDVPVWLRRLTGWRLHATLAGFGALSALAHAPFHVFPLFALGLCALVWTLDATAPGEWGRAWARGGSFGFGYFLAGLYWVGSAFLSVEAPIWLMLAAMLALAGGLGFLFWGPALALARLMWRAGPRRIAALALCVSLAELARAVVFTGFPWNLPGHVWAAGGAVSQLASLVGASGLGVLTLLALAAPAALADTGASLGRRALPALLAALGLGLAWGWGAQRLASAPAAPGGPIVRVVDAGYSQAERWSVDPDVQLARYLELSQAPEASAATVVVWPESAIPGSALLEDDLALRVIGEQLGDRVLLTGLVRRGDQPDRFHNSLAVLDAVDGRLSIGQVYDKHHLVPFGEYLPFWELYSEVPLAPLQAIGRGFTPGPPPGRLFVPGAPPVTPLICYEGIFAGLIPRGADRPEWIVNVSLDSWFGQGSGPWQHVNAARYRAIEEGLPLARAAAGGISGIFDAYGRKVVATNLDGGAVEAAIPPPLQPTVYTRLAWCAPLLGIFLLLCIRFAPKRR